MGKFRFIVQSDSGKVRRGSITESDENAARERLESAGFEVVSLTESTDLVVHAPTQGSSGRAKTRIQRAALIDFEETFSEKLGRMLNTYFLRREVAMILAVGGLIWIISGMFGGPDAPKTEEVSYISYLIKVEVSDNGLEPGKVEVRLPDVPFKVAEDWEGGSAQEVVLDFEAARQPDRVEVTLYSGNEKIGFQEGHLSSAGPGQFSFSASPEPTPSKR